MASNSKKRRRVLGASCILAALIIASSSFAWFTSKDEVTNRLTANSDYGVSIVESFVPPKNMIPGQEINKDVYSVNTGNIAAFVKETVSGILNYTYESKVDAFDATKAVELTETAAKAIDGATTEEAGGFLAWTSASGVPLGSVNSARTEDAVANTWHPTVEGDYIFRRSIDTTGAETKFTYAGYHFVPGTPAQGIEGEVGYVAAVPDKYYKIVIGNDPFRAAEEGYEAADGTRKFVFDIASSSLGTGVEVDKDGKVTSGTPTVKYVIENEVKNAVPVLTYGEDVDVNRDGNSDKYLAAYYTDGQAAAAALASQTAALTAAQDNLKTAETNLNNASAQATKDEVAYQDALGAYNTALSKYTQTKLDYDYAKALTDATNALISAANTRGQAENAKDQDASELQTAASELKSTANGLFTGNTWLADMDTDYDSPTTAADAVDASSYGSKSLITPATRARINAYNTQYGGLDSVINNIGLMDAKYAQIKEYASKIYEALTILKGIEAGDPNVAANWTNYKTDVEVNAQQKIIDDNYDLLVTAMEEYEHLYTGIVQNTNAIAEANLTDLVFDNTTAVSDFRAGDFASLTRATLDSKADTYEEKYKDYKTQVETTIPNANKAWETAVNTYNKTVTTAKNTYDTGISATRPSPNMYGENGTGTASYLNDSNTQVKLNLKDNGKTLVPFNDADKTAGYSANFTQNNDDPTIGTYNAATDKTTDAPAWTIYTQEKKPDGNTPYSTREVSSTITPVKTMTVEEETAFAPLKTSDGTKLGTRKDGSTPATVGSLAEALDTAETTLKTKKDTYLGTDGTGTTTGSKADLAAKQTAYANAQTAVATAQGALDDTTASGSAIRMYIVLDDDVNDNWTKEAVKNGNGDTVAYNFYLNKVLEAGETSEKLIDYVMLDKDTKSADYKDLTFDLNVGLDSAQVTYDANQQNYTAEAVVAPTFTKTATVGEDNSTVTWADAAPAPAPAPTTTNVDVIVDGADAEHNLIKMVKTGTGDSATWAVADSGSTITDAASGYHYTINGTGVYRNVVTGLIPALNTVTGDTPPVVAYVAD